jgi:hypothetical protein
VSVTGFALTHGDLAHRLAPSDLIFAFAAQWVGVVLFVLMAFAVWGSIQFSLSERGDVELTELGVRRTFKAGREEFFPREEIAGFIPRSFGGVSLVEQAGKRQMVIPRSIEGYRDCIAQLKAMGIPALPAALLHSAQKKLSFAEHIFNVFAFVVSSVAGDLLIGRQNSSLDHWIAGLILGALLLVALFRGRHNAYNFLPWLLGGCLSAVFRLWWHR